MIAASIESTQRSPVWEALLVALLVEAALIAVGVSVLERNATPPVPPPEPLQVELAPAPPAPEPPKPPTPAANTPEPQKPQPRTLPPELQPKIHPQREKTQKPATAAVAEKPAEPSMPEPVEPLDAAPSAFAAAPAAPPPPQPPPPQANAATPADVFQAALRAAVQAAVRYPSAARVMKLVGNTRLGFDYLDGRVINPHVVRSSGSELLDRAALEALLRAVFPAPPKELAGHSMHLEIAVVFSLQS